MEATPAKDWPVTAGCKQPWGHAEDDQEEANSHDVRYSFRYLNSLVIVLDIP